MFGIGNRRRLSAERERLKDIASRPSAVEAAREVGPFIPFDKMEEEFGTAVRSLHEIDTDTVRQWLESRRDDLQNGMVQLDKEIGRLTERRRNKLEALEAVNAGLQKLGSATGRSPDEIKADVEGGYGKSPAKISLDAIGEAKAEFERSIPNWKSKPLDPTDEFYASDGDKPALLKHKHILPGSSGGLVQGRDGEWVDPDEEIPA